MIRKSINRAISLLLAIVFLSANNIAYSDQDKLRVPIQSKTAEGKDRLLASVRKLTEITSFNPVMASSGTPLRVDASALKTIEEWEAMFSALTEDTILLVDSKIPSFVILRLAKAQKESKNSHVKGLVVLKKNITVNDMDEIEQLLIPVIGMVNAGEFDRLAQAKTLTLSSDGIAIAENHGKLASNQGVGFPSWWMETGGLIMAIEGLTKLTSKPGRNVVLTFKGNDFLPYADYYRDQVGAEAMREGKSIVDLSDEGIDAARELGKAIASNKGGDWGVEFPTNATMEQIEAILIDAAGFQIANALSKITAYFETLSKGWKEKTRVAFTFDDNFDGFRFQGISGVPLHEEVSKKEEIPIEYTIRYIVGNNVDISSLLNDIGMQLVKRDIFEPRAWRIHVSNIITSIELTEGEKLASNGTALSYVAAAINDIGKIRSRIVHNKYQSNSGDSLKLDIDTLQEIVLIAEDPAVSIAAEAALESIANMFSLGAEAEMAKAALLTISETRALRVTEGVDNMGIVDDIGREVKYTEELLSEIVRTQNFLIELLSLGKHKLMPTNKFAEEAYYREAVLRLRELAGDSRRTVADASMKALEGVGKAYRSVIFPDDLAETNAIDAMTMRIAVDIYSIVIGAISEIRNPHVINLMETASGARAMKTGL